MRNILISFVFALMMVAYLPVPAANIDTGDQVAYCVDQIADLQAVPAVENILPALGYKCIPACEIDAIVPVGKVPLICLDNPPEMIYLCGVDVNTDAAKTTIKELFGWFGSNLWWIASILLVISEGLGLTDKIESNGILSFIFKWLKKKAVKPN